MKKIYSLLFLFTALIYLSACNKDTDAFTPDPGQPNGPDQNWYTTITSAMPVADLRSSLLLSPAIDSFPVGNISSSVLSATGIYCTVLPNSIVDHQSHPINGMIGLESYLLKKKGDFVRMGVSTISGDKLLITAGDFSVRLKKGGDELELNQNATIYESITDSTANSNLKLYLGDNSGDQISWSENNDSANHIASTLQGYNLVSRHLNWTSIAQLYDTSVARVKLNTLLPANYTNANTLVYVVFRDFRSVCSLNGDYNTKTFSSIPLPVGNAVTVIVLSKQGNDYFFGTGVTSTGNGSTIQTIAITPSISTLSNIKQYLNSL